MGKEPFGVDVILLDVFPNSASKLLWLIREEVLLSRQIGTSLLYGKWEIPQQVE